MQRHLGFTFLMMGLCVASQAFGQPAGSSGRQLDPQFHLFGGVLSSGTLIETHRGGEPVSGRADSGIIAGFRLGEEEEFAGWELTLAAVLDNVEIKADPFATDLPAESDATLILGMINLMYYPAGNSMADGRVRPFVTAGTGLGYMSADDFEELDDEWIYDLNAGFGLKFLLGDEGDTILRLDWRWHQMRDFSSQLKNIYRQEISIGIGMRY